MGSILNSNTHPKPDHAGALRYAAKRLSMILAKQYAYHNSAHTFDQVLPAALYLAGSQSLGEDERDLLMIGAAFHDIGYTVNPQNHEEIGVGIAHEVLPGYGYSAEQIETIAGLILATRLPQSPRTPLEKIMADADLLVLGQDAFFPTNGALRVELAQLGRDMNEIDWLLFQINFLKQHHYFTKEARKIGDPGKKKHIREMTRRLIHASLANY